MSTSFTFRKTVACMGIGMAALLGANIASAQVQSGTTGINATGNTQSERVDCVTGRTQQDRATCLREANNAAADKARGVLDNSGGQFASNAMQRCDVLSGEDKAACQARIAGYGTTDGSVAGGGVVRTVETAVIPAGSGPVIVESKTPNPVILVPTN